MLKAFNSTILKFSKSSRFIAFVLLILGVSIMYPTIRNNTDSIAPMAHSKVRSPWPQ